MGAVAVWAVDGLVGRGGERWFEFLTALGAARDGGFLCVGVAELQWDDVGLCHRHDALEVLDLVGGGEAYRRTLRVHPGGSPYPVEVVGGVLGYVVVYYVCHLVDVEPPRSDVCGDEDTELAGAEGFGDSVPLRLR